MQLMSELVRKAEADINTLRGRLAVAGTAPRADPSTGSHSAALLQVSCRLTREVADTSTLGLRPRVVSQ